MEAFRTEVHSLFIRPFLDEAHERLGPARVAALLASLGVDERRLRDETAWVSLAFCEALFAALLEAIGDPAMFDRCGRLALTPRYAGFTRTVARAVGSPTTVYRAVVGSLTPRFNKVGAYTLEDRGRGAVRLTYRTLPNARRESGDLVCRARAAQLAAIPTMFDLPSGEVEHLDCMHRGAAACVYDIRWVPGRRPWEPTVAAVTGGALVAAGAAGAGLAAPFVVAGGALGLVGGGALGVARRLQSSLEARNAQIAEQQDEVLRALEANERRYQELVEAKDAVDRQVSERTAALRATSDRLASTLEEVQALDRAKTDFFNNVSHDLRTPLTLVLGGLDEALAEGTLDEASRQRLDVARRNAARLLRLINQLLDLARVEAGRERLARAPVDVALLARDVAASFAGAAARREIVLRVDAEELPSVPLDAGWVESALVNLVSNALRHAPVGGHVTVRVRETPDGVCLTVEDDGPGLTPEDQARVFERFAQAPGTRGGTGLGLAIVREAARLHGGRAGVESEPGRGARFTLTLPLQSPGDGGADDTPAEAGAAAGGAEHGGDETSQQGRASSPPAAPADAPLVLVVEDGEDLRDHVARILARRYRVLVASDGEEGLEIARERRPDAIVSDVMMPRLDGLGLCRAIREDPATRATPFLLLTAQGGPDRVAEGFEAGADDYLTKPFHARELLARVGVHVRLRLLISEIAHAERLAAIGTMAASVAHEVRNPLTALSSGLTALRRRWSDRFDARTRELVDVLVDCADRVDRVTGDLLHLSRVDRAEVDRFSPGAGLASTVRLLRTRAGERVVIEEDVDVTATMVGRPGDLNHAFMNLVDNALRAVDGEGRVVVHAGVEGDDFVAVVEDSGAGIPEDQVDRVFQPFYSTRAAGEGTGLGLAIARQAVDRHGGSLSVGRSELGGARFEIRIPRVASQDDPPP